MYFSHLNTKYHTSRDIMNYVILYHNYNRIMQIVEACKMYPSPIRPKTTTHNINLKN